MLRDIGALGATVLFAVACGGASAVPITPSPGAVVVAAVNLVFTPGSVRAPAGEGFELSFDNRDPVPHNARLVDGTGQTIVQTEVFTGPSARVEDVPALQAGTYKLLCDVHPEMSGELIAGT
jgi:plastocyanin